MIDDKNMQAVCGLCNKYLKTILIKKIKRYDKLYDVYFCKECMVGLTVPIPSPDDLSRLYLSSNYRAANGKRFYPFIEYFIKRFRHQRKKRIQKYIKKGRILDIGCGRGLFLDIMKKDDWDVTGVEYNEDITSHASDAYGIKVVTIISLNQLPDESFDVITLSHVLEHSDKPATLINECKRLLRKGGLLFIAVPNISSLQASVGKKVWFHLDIPYHLHHFSEEGISTLLEKNSFKILKVKQFDLEYNPFGWLQTLYNLSGISENFLYNLLKSPDLGKKDISNVTKKDLILTLFLLPIFSPLSIIFSLFESLILKRGGTVEIQSVKE